VGNKLTLAVAVTARPGTGDEAAMAVATDTHQGRMVSGLTAGAVKG
jgi:hypothetical protein